MFLLNITTVLLLMVICYAVGVVTPAVWQRWRQHKAANRAIKHNDQFFNHDLNDNRDSIDSEGGSKD